jgi:hypothetical protein
VASDILLTPTSEVRTSVQVGGRKGGRNKEFSALPVCVCVRVCVRVLPGFSFSRVSLLLNRRPFSSIMARKNRGKVSHFLLPALCSRMLMLVPSSLQKEAPKKEKEEKKVDITDRSVEELLAEAKAETKVEIKANRDTADEYRSATGVLYSQPTALDVKIGGFTLTGYGRELIKDTEIEFTVGRRYGLIGANGSGKSTFLRCMAAREVFCFKRLSLRLLFQTLVLSCAGTDSGFHRYFLARARSCTGRGNGARGCGQGTRSRNAGFCSSAWASHFVCLN